MLCAGLVLEKTQSFGCKTITPLQNWLLESAADSAIDFLLVCKELVLLHLLWLLDKCKESVTLWYPPADDPKADALQEDRELVLDVVLQGL